MVRKLDKIEKEMGYCEIKLEKERRFRRQLEFLRADLEVIDRFLSDYRGLSVGGRGASLRPERLGGLPFPSIGDLISKERQTRQEPGPAFHRARESFVSAGLVEVVLQERDLVVREIEDLEAKFGSFDGFSKKRETLVEEKRQALLRVAPQVSSRVRELDEDFRRIEHRWHVLTEDALNLDEALFFLSRSVDYVKSSRSFLIAAKGSFDIESWIEENYTGDLFRHSNIGRAKEMFEGANRNLKLAQKELVCVSHSEFDIEGFEPVLVEFLGSLFDDVFIDARLDRTIVISETATVKLEAKLADAKERRQALHVELESTEEERLALFQALGGDR